ncbi:hypothetical protein E1301_Tti019766 [Triplophysa tibetana]|uniref:C-type lectin domain-containing protein n=1 Tax=Triplophysa tibetana TaxID=1572043 RepID=A0A5A9PMN1_9TELE|nr:hypothetical protein E1301_Tti019766 [Triplophysa tibetana]
MKESVSVLLVLCGLTTGFIRDHILVNIPKNWTDARGYCREHYTDLSTVQSIEEQQILIKLKANSKSTWIGLSRDMKNLKMFLWSDGDSYSFSQWKSEKLTWEEALEYCKVHHNDLASLPTELQLQLIKTGTLEAQTDSVWTGLRFLAGEWFWLDGKPLGDQVKLLACPVQPRRCGARNTKTDKWENRDCEEKLNFLCK